MLTIVNGVTSKQVLANEIINLLETMGLDGYFYYAEKDQWGNPIGGDENSLPPGWTEDDVNDPDDSDDNAGNALENIFGGLFGGFAAALRSLS